MILKTAHRSRSVRADGRLSRADDIYLLLQLDFPTCGACAVGIVEKTLSWGQHDENQKRHKGMSDYIFRIYCLCS